MIAYGQEIQPSPPTTPEATEQVWHAIQAVHAQLQITGVREHMPISSTRTITTRPTRITALVRQRRSCMNVDPQPQYSWPESVTIACRRNSRAEQICGCNE